MVGSTEEPKGATASLQRLCGVLGRREDSSPAVSRQVAAHFKCDFAAAARLYERQGVRWQASEPAWSNELVLNRRRVVALLGATGELCAALEAAGCPVAAVEGGGVVAAFSELDPGGYDSGDVDLLVGGAGALAQVVRAAGCLGWDVRSQERHHLTLVRLSDDGDSLRLEVDAEAFYRRVWPRPGRRQDWLAHRVLPEVASGLRVLGAEASLVYTAVHASIHTYVRSPGLRLWVDMDRLIAHAGSLDWSRVVDLAMGAHCQTRVYMALKLTRRYLDTPVPPRILESLAPHGLRVQLLDRLLDGRGFLPPQRPLNRARVAAVEALLSDR